MANTPSDAEVAFLTSEINNQYEQFRHQDHLRISYLQIYFTLASVLFAGTGLALDGALSELSLVVLLAVGYLFMFAVGELSIRMMISLRLVQLETALLLDMARSYLGRAFAVEHALLYFEAQREAEFYEPKASSTWIFRFIATLNATFLAIGISFAVGALWVRAAGDLHGLPWWTWGLGMTALVGVSLAVVPQRALRRLEANALELRERLRLPERYSRLGQATPPLDRH